MDTETISFDPRPALQSLGVIVASDFQTAHAELGKLAGQLDNDTHADALKELFACSDSLRAAQRELKQAGHKLMCALAAL